MTRPLDSGRFAAAVSIRCGRGSMTHDRVMRFVPVFDTDAQATRFATDQALAWIGEPACKADDAASVHFPLASPSGSRQPAPASAGAFFQRIQQGSTT